MNHADRNRGQAFDSSILRFYSDFSENGGRVTFAQRLNDATLDRSYYYDHVGRLEDVHTGAEARAALQGQGATPDGPYSHHYWYDQFGNMGFAWAGVVRSAGTWSSR